MTVKEYRLHLVAAARKAMASERAAGRDPSPPLWAAVDVAERFAHGEATEDERRAAESTASTFDDAAKTAWDVAAFRDAPYDVLVVKHAVYTAANLAVQATRYIRTDRWQQFDEEVTP